jgi:DNA-binding PadR family transcriptional regulator
MDNLPSPSSLLPLPVATFHILLVLCSGDRHGYGIIQDIAARTDGEVKLGPGTLYRNLQRLQEDGLIVEIDERPLPSLDDERRRYFRITPFGGAVARAEIGRLSRLLELAQGTVLSPDALSADAV